MLSLALITLCLVPSAWAGAAEAVEADAGACSGLGPEKGCAAPEEKGDRGSVLLQRGSLGGKVTLKSEPEEFPELQRRTEHIDVVARVTEGPLPLCHESIVAATCVDLNEGQRNIDTVTAKRVQELVSLNSTAMRRLWRALKLTGKGKHVTCQALCEAVVDYVEESGGILPNSSDRACYTVEGKTTCDVDVSPQKIVHDMSDGLDVQPDEGFKVHGGEALIASGRHVQRSIRSTREGFKVSRRHVAAGAEDERPVMEEGEEEEERRRRRYCPYTLWEAAELIANFFRIFPSLGRGPVIDFPPGASLAQSELAATASQTIASNNAQAKSWVSQVVLQLANQQAASYRQKWFGGSGSLSQNQVRNRIILTEDFIERELDTVRYVYPADNAKDTACKGGASAYVWKSSTSATGYHETTGPLCKNTDDPFQKHCAVDTSGRFFVYLCQVWMNDPLSWRISTLIHEAAHHTGPTDHSYDKSTMMAMKQSKQIDNAANYQHFSAEVANAAFGCVDNNPPNVPFGCTPGPCTCGPLAAYCNDATYGAIVRSQCPATCGSCNGQSPSPPPPPPPPPTPSPPVSGGCSQPSGKTTVVLGSKSYTATCSGFASNGACQYLKVKNRCPVSCGVCSPSSGAGCADDPNYSISTQIGVLTCDDWKKYQCWDEVKPHCPVSCNSGCAAR